MSAAFREIRRAKKQYSYLTPGLSAALVLRSGDAEQKSHGVTQAALAAWHDLRLTFFQGSKAVAVGGVVDYEVVYNNYTTFEGALYVERQDGKRVYLTGCSWGYGGEGPHGTATVLADLGAFPTAEEALEFTSRVPIGEPWRREL